MDIIELSKKENRKQLRNAIASVPKDILVAAGDCIPFVPAGTFLENGIKTVGTIHDILFYRKLLAFLEGMDKDTITDEEFDEFSRTVDDNKKKVESFLINVVNLSESEEKAKILGIIYKAAVKRKISVDDMLRLCSIVHRAFIHDFKALPDYVDSNEKESIEANNFINYGLIDNFVGGYWVNSPSYQLNETGCQLYQILKDEGYFD